MGKKLIHLETYEGKRIYVATIAKAIKHTFPEGSAEYENRTEAQKTLEYTLSNLPNIIGKEAHPIGSIYMSTSATNPSEIYEGTTWEPYAEDRTVVGVGEGYALNAEGGALEVALTASQLPQHTHQYGGYTVGAWTAYTAGRDSNWIPYGLNLASSGGYFLCSNVGNNVPHNNVQPSHVIYMWKRVA